MKDLVESKGSIKTTIISNETGSNVYEIIREFTNVSEKQTEEVILFTLYPTIADVNKLDLSAYHFNAHMEDMNIKVAHWLFLFSKVTNARMSVKDIEVDERNLEYIRQVLKKYKSAKVVVGWGSAMSKNSIVNDTKSKILEMFYQLRENQKLYQIGGNGIEAEENYHPLFCGLRFGNKTWKLISYKPLIENKKDEVKKEDTKQKTKKVVQISKEAKD